MVRYKKISKILWLILIANILIAAIKIITSLKVKSNSLLADGYHGLTDSFSNIIGLIGIRLSSKPSDDKHPYGYQKFESIASFIIGIFLFILSGQIVLNSINYFINPEILEIDNLSLVFLFFGLIINIIIARVEYKKGMALKSEVLIADSIHTRSDIFISSGVILSLVLIKAGFPSIIDPLLSLIIAILVFHSGIMIFKDSISSLVDTQALDKNEIMKIIYEYSPDIVDVHKIRSRGKGEHVFLDLHLLINPEKTVREAHDLNHELENILNLKLEKKIELNAHIEPSEK